MTMHFSDLRNGKRNNSARLALVAGLHLAVGVAFVHSLNTRHLSLPFMPDPVTVVLQPDPPTPPTPVDLPMPTQQLAPPPTLFVPPPEVTVAAPPDPAPTVTATSAEPQPAPPAQPAQPADPGPPAVPHTVNPGQMHTALFADANSCALPAYPPKAVREGETGTTTLALLVGTDGRVSSARVQHTSGSRELDRAALQALSLCKFKPATNNGVPEAAWAQLAYVWTLD
jgi:protein TonB